MKSIPPSIQRLVREFNKLPGIGSKTSERFVFYLLRQPKTEIESLAQNLLAIKDNIRLCHECYTFAEAELCSVCMDSTRSRKTICIVAEPKDMLIIEQTGEFDGVYHVLGGVINATEGIGPQQLRMEELLKRIEQNGTTEVILATNPDMEGETTALYIAQLLSDKPVSLSKIARGLPMGADIQFADEATLANAFRARQQMNSR